MAVDEGTHETHASDSLGPQVELEVGCDGAQFAQRARLKLAYTLACDAEPGSDLFQRLGGLAVETEAERKHTAHAWVQPEQRLRELRAAELVRGRLVRPFRMDVFDQVGVHALAVADRSLEADRILDQVEQ